MAQVSVTLNGRTFQIQCGDGEEARLLQLAGHLSMRLEALSHEFGQIGDDKLLIMASLLITDELWVAREMLAMLQDSLKDATNQPVSGAAEAAAKDKRLG